MSKENNLGSASENIPQNDILFKIDILSNSPASQISANTVLDQLVANAEYVRKLVPNPLQKIAILEEQFYDAMKRSSDAYQKMAKSWTVLSDLDTMIGDTFKKMMDLHVTKALSINARLIQLFDVPAADAFKMYSGSEVTGAPKKEVAGKVDIYQFESDVSDLEATAAGRIILLNEINKAKRIITDVYKNNSVIYRLEPREFEEMIAELLYSQGFETKLTKQTRDGGYDIIAIAKKGPFPMTLLAECKRYGPKKPVGVEIMRSFAYVVEKQMVNKGVMFTSSYFTKGAINAAKKEMGHLLEFMENSDIMEWIKSYIKPS